MTPKPVGPGTDSPFSDLLHAVLDGRATVGEWSQLSAILESNPAACDEYATHVALHARLRQVVSGHGSLMPLPLSCPISLDASQELSCPSPASRRSGGKRLLSLARLTGLTAALMVAVTAVWMTFNDQPPAAPSQLIANIWYFDSANDQSIATPIRTSRVSQGEEILLEQGFAEIMLNSGVTIRLSSPCRLTVDNQMLCTLGLGRAYVSVPPNAHGFQLRTLEAQITDYGTEFGVAVDADGKAKVAVVKGEIGVRTDDLATEMKLTTGQGVTIESKSLKRLYFVDEASFPTSRDNARLPLIVDVFDNVRDIESLRYYRVRPGAFEEEAPIYVDRGHEYNGVTSEGLPAYLRGAAYLMTFNGDKQLRDLELTVTLSAPADVYVLFDTRAPVPQWLQSEFQKMPEEVGVDEVSVSEGYERLDEGPGKSIDNRFSVWKKTVDHAGPVTVGAMAAATSYFSMYTIVAVPLEK
ncbi:FecR domain-containing protein [Planctomicrobium piriforme]|uniref:FecR protein n=1 Tax=Planctomicrobium piriforme TaxID=1576369 RepID=A0A1I3KQI4_9PLAN|nr:FecR domain-containing protein [Planctomicrobium piriforme]SFI74598.1 FecR protein [Planctomicrobium piriforme]